MGNSASDAQYLEEMNRNYQCQKIRNQYYGDCTIFQSKINIKQKYIMKEFNYSDETLFKRNRIKFEQRQMLKSEHILSIQKIFSQSDKQLCGNFLKLSVLIEHPQTRLESIIVDQKDHWSLLFGYVRGLEVLQKNLIQHNQIQKKNLYIPPKICDPTYFEASSNYQQYISGVTNGIYLSPILYRCATQKDCQPQHNSYKSDVFTLGMCLLSSFLRIDLSDCYQDQFLDFLMLSKLNKYRQSSIPQLGDILAAMLTIKEQSRPDFIELSHLLNTKYQESQLSQTKVKTLPVQNSPNIELLKPDVADSIPFISLSSNECKISKVDENLDPNEELIEDDSVFVQPLNEKSDFINQNKTTTDNSKLQDYHHSNNNSIAHGKSFSLPFDLPEKVNEIYEDGSRYEGFKQNGMRHGNGQFYYQDGGFYDGNWKNNHMHGQGTLFYSNGQPAYHGEWNDDKFSGYGVIYNEAPSQLVGPFNYQDFDQVEDYWIRYEGEFDDDNKEGQGTLLLSNGDQYIGQFHKDYIHGIGKFITSKGDTIQGNWLNNKLVKAK